MEGRGNYRRGGWKRGGRGGNDGESFGGEHRGRGRGGHHRGRGKRDHHRGHARGGRAGAVDSTQRHQDEEERFEEEEDRAEVFSRRKLASNWDRYEESALLERDDDLPTRRGVDYHELLQSAGDSFSQFRFSEEKEWEMDPVMASQMSAVVLDLPALAQTLQQVPLHQRLNLEAELVQEPKKQKVSAPAELPAVTLTPKQEVSKTSKFTPSCPAVRGLSINHRAPPVPPAAAEPVGGDDGDADLDQLLGLQKPDRSAAGTQSVSGAEEESAEPEQAHEDEIVPTGKEEVKVKDVTPPKSPSIRKEMTEDDLEDWLDSMIS